jgi:plasmid stability protein
MDTTITIRHVPQEVRNELAARAAAAGRSMQEYLRLRLIEDASRPDMKAVLERIQSRKAATKTALSTEQILEYRDSGRR